MAAPSEPAAAASTGAATPRKIVPSTAAIKKAGGTRDTRRSRVNVTGLIA